ncbi:RHS repeat-associated core domain-containing protein [Ketobacter sp.]
MKRLIPELTFVAAGILCCFSVHGNAESVPCGTPFNTNNELGTATGVHAYARGSDGLICNTDNEYSERSASGSVSASNTDSVYHYFNGKLLDIPVRTKSSARASQSGLTVSASDSQFDVHYAGGSARALARDSWQVTIGSGNQVIPFSFCARFEGEGPSFGYSNLVNFNLSAPGGTITHNAPNSPYLYYHFADGNSSFCGQGSIHFNFPEPTQTTISAYSSLVIQGHLSSTIVSGVNIQTLKGSAAASFSIDATAYDCESSGGNAAGCELPPTDPQEEIDKALPKAQRQYDQSDCGTGANQLVGNPINFIYGYKLQNEVDYVGNVLSFKRNYRSDKTWTNENIGKHWHHNYDRKLTIDTSGANNKAELIDENGRAVNFYHDGNAWVSEYSDSTEKFSDDANGGYIYTDNAETKEYYNSAGQLTRIAYAGREAVDLSYTSDLLTTVSDQSGNSLTFSYNSDNQITSVTTPAGSFTYSYDGALLTTIEKPDSTTRIYHYEDTRHFGALTGVTDESGNRYSTYEYDEDGRAISSEHDSGIDSYQITYNADDTITVTNPLGKETTYSYITINGLRKITNVVGHASTNCAAGNKSYSYTAEGWIKSKTDWEGNVTTYDYDPGGRLKEIILDDGGDDEHDIDYTYIGSTRLIDTVIQGKLKIDYDYDSNDRIEKITRTDLNTGEARVTSYNYYSNTTDANGNDVLGKLHTVDGPRTDVSDVTTYEYDGLRRLYKTTNAAGHVTEIISFDQADRPLVIRDANGIETVLTYDDMGRVLTSTAAYGTANAATRTYGYDGNGNVTSIRSANGVEMTYEYDEVNRLEVITDDLGNTITYTRDDAGNIVREDYKDSSSTLKYTHSRIYDELSRLIESVDANLDSTLFGYDLNSNLKNITDAESNPTTYAFDGLNRLRQQTDALNGITSYALNEFGDTQSVTDPRSNTTSYSYNAFGDVLSETSPDRGSIIYTVDKAGNVTSRTDARDIVTSYTYDALNRLANVSYPSDGNLNQSFVYDSESNCGFSKGRLCSITHAGGIDYYVYDELGRLIQVTEDRGNGYVLTTGYSYYEDVSLFGILLPSGREVLYGLDDAGQVNSVATGYGGAYSYVAFDIKYAPFGGIENLTYGNGIALSNSYNPAYQLTVRQHGALFNESYSYDNVGNVTATSSDSYTYDDLYRLITDGSDSYSYDAIGNRLSYNGLSYIYPNDSSRLSAVGSASISTDDGGYITSDQNHSYGFNAAGQLATIGSAPTYTAAYSYNANNLRTKKVTAAGTTHYVYGRNGQLYGEYNGSGALIREYVYLNGEPLAVFDATGAITYLHTDHLGTPRIGSDSTGAMVWAWDSDAFGNDVSSTNLSTMPLRFAGQYEDTESALFYNWNRYYNPATGRYISSDPIGLDGGLNTYGYASTNPIMFTDPRGLETQSERDKRANDYIREQQKRADKLAKLACSVISGSAGKVSSIYKSLPAWVKRAINKYDCQNALKEFYMLDAKLDADRIRKGIEECPPDVAIGESCLNHTAPEPEDMEPDPYGPFPEHEGLAEPDCNV